MGCDLGLCSRWCSSVTTGTGSSDTCHIGAAGVPGGTVYGWEMVVGRLAWVDVSPRWTWKCLLLLPLYQRLRGAVLVRRSLLTLRGTTQGSGALRTASRHLSGHAGLIPRLTTNPQVRGHIQGYQDTSYIQESGVSIVTPPSLHMETFV